MAPIVSPDMPSSLAESKNHREHKKQKKRAREEEGGDDSGRRHKRSKSISNAIPDQDKKRRKEEKFNVEENGVEAPHGSTSKGKKKSSHDPITLTGPLERQATEEVDVDEDREHKRKKEKKKKKKEKAKKEEKNADVPEEAESVEKAEKAERKRLRKERRKREKQAEAEARTEPAPTPNLSRIYQPDDIPVEPQFPFYTQTVSLYEPLYPVGWSQPVTNVQAQHLQHLLNRYVPALQGVLLDYRNVAFGESPGRSAASTDDDTPLIVACKNEAAVGFGWITADVDMFKPSRGAWMEGSISLQTEGHIGLTCFGRFNASIEASRLPRTWHWVPNDDATQGFEENASVLTADEHGVTRQIHSTGYWVDENLDKVKGKVRYRIRNFDVGVSGDTSYLSLEGTMLDRSSESKLVEEEAKVVRMRRAIKGNNSRGSLKLEKRIIPDFAMTRFTPDKDEIQQNEAETRQARHDEAEMGEEGRHDGAEERIDEDTEETLANE